MEHRFPHESLTQRAAYPWFVVATVCVGAFMAALDASIVNVAMPTLLTHFRGGMQRIEWVSVSYLLTLTALLTVFGRISDMVGRRLMYSLGFTVFVIGSALCGMAPHLNYLICARVLQAAGAAMLQANSVAIITANMSSRQRGKAIGIQGSAQAIGLSVGPAIGGLLITYFGWRAIFYVNIPIGLIGTLLGIVILPRDTARVKQKFDYLGALLLTPALVFILLIVTDGNQAGWLSAPILGYAALSVVFLYSFYIWERRVKNPMVDLSLFRSRTMTFGNITGLLSFAIMYGVLFLVPFYLEHVRQQSPSSTGYLLTAVPIAMAIITPVAGYLADRFNRRMLTLLGMVFATVSTLMVGFIINQPSFLFLVIALLLLGIGQGIFTPANNSSVMGSVRKTQLGLAGGILNMSRSFGMGFGVAIAGAVYQSSLVFFSTAGNNPSVDVMIQSFRLAFLAIALLGICATVLVLLYRASELHGLRESRDSSYL
ncbi:MAG: drug resistance transporter, EmrB/QacA subfamily [Bacilli bacterium]|nr:drug resistance transporter, EmrB/QacA subfamily [Bacilli bacterium]